MNRYYTPEEKIKCVQLAQNIGAAAAIRKLGYPKAPATLHQWTKDFDIVPSHKELAHKAKKKQFISEAEMIVSNEAVIRRGYDLLKNDGLKPTDLRAIGESIRTAISTINDIKASVPEDEHDTLEDNIDELLSKFSEQV